MKRRVIRRVEHGERPREEFYEAVPAPTQPVYREGPAYRDEREAEKVFSGWAIVGLAVLAAVILLLLFGRAAFNPTLNSNNGPNDTTTPSTDTPAATPVVE